MIRTWIVHQLFDGSLRYEPYAETKASGERDWKAFRLGRPASEFRGVHRWWLEGKERQDAH